MLAAAAAVLALWGLRRGPGTSGVTAALLEAADTARGWPTFGHDYGNRRYAPLAEIDSVTVGRLRPAWTYTFPPAPHAKGTLHTTTPLFSRGVLYLTGAGSSVTAVDARNGREIWRYAAVLGDLRLCCGGRSRGAALLGDRVFAATVDARLLALRTRDGRPVWEVRLADPAKGYSVTMAPLVADGKVIVGVSGGEFRARGFLDAYHPQTGRRVWRFWTVPSPEQGGWWGRWAITTADGDTLPRDLVRERADSARYADTWRQGGGGIWATPAYDPEHRWLYVGTGNPAPPLDGSERPGDNLYTASLLALDVQTGRLAWYHQFVPHDLWDYDIGVPPVLFQLRANGEAAPVVSVPTKMGWVYMLDRRDGRQLVRSEALVPQQNLFAAPGPEGTLLQPGPPGGSTWAPAAYSPRTGLLYVSALNLPMQLFVGARSPTDADGRYNFGGGGVAFKEEQWSVISAVDPGSGTIRWARRLMGGTRHTAALATAGDLVFVTEGKTLRALDAWTGRPRWAYELRDRVEAPPISYEFGGRQYVAVATMKQLVAFALEAR